jgi:predicted extracellular nuclease
MRRRTSSSLVAVLALLVALLPALPALAADGDILINEVRIDQPSTDLDEYFELMGPAGASLDGLTYLVIGDGTGGSGVVEEVTDLAGSALGPDGFFVAAESTFSYASDLVTDLNFENSDNVTHLLVRGFTGSDGDDLDTDDDGVLDVMPWSEVVDLVALVEEENPPSSTEFHYGPPSVGPDGIYVPGHVYWCEFGWQIGAFSGGDDTPGAANVCEAPAADLVINEIDYDQPSTDTAEFVEIKNNGGDAVSLDGWSLVLVNGTGGGAAVYSTIPLPAVSLAAGDYFVVCADAATVANCDLDVAPDSNLIQNGAPDAVALYNGETQADTESYEGDTGAPYTEGSGAGLADTGDGSISRCPDGADTNVNNADFVFGAVSPGAENPCVVEDPFGACGDPATLIHAIQGSGPTSPDVGVVRTIEGVVVGDFENTSTATGLGGFFVQEEDADADADPMTSEGIFVYTGSQVGVSKGDTVRVRGTVTEYFGLTELGSVTDFAMCPATGTATPAVWTLPVSSVDDWETVEGMEITISDTLFVSGNYTQGRYGEVDLSVGGPLDNPTNIAAPGAPALAVMEANALRRIQLDDGSTAQNPLPLPPYLGPDGTLRTGDTTDGLTGAVGYAFGVYEVHPTQPVTFARVNERPAPPEVGGRLTVAAYNVLNYFTTIDDGSPVCGPLGDQDCRGADSADELARQRSKLVAAISNLDADVVGLMEIENHPGDVPTADLVAGLNDAVGAGTYDFVATGAIGSDAIRLALIYQPAAVTPLGDFAVLDSSVDPTFDDDKNRPVLAQSFVENATGAVFTIAVNHLKSKGSPCDDVGDPNAGDGQGNCNLTRTAAAAALADWLAGDPTGSGSDAFLIVGDLNAYAQEDPITTLEGAGWIDLIEAFVGTGFADGAYSYNYFSESGYLDHALASPGMLSQVEGAAFWHVNADEPSALDYNDYNQPALFAPDEFRSSDHDPVVVGLDLDTPAGLKADTRDMLAALLPTGHRRTDHFLQKAVNKITQSLREAWWIDDATLHPKRGKFVFDREHHAVQFLLKVVAMDRPEAAAAQEAIGMLIAADRQLAFKAIFDAAGGHPKWLGFAEIRFAQADALVEAGDYGLAVLTYRKAWRLANKASRLGAG